MPSTSRPIRRSPDIPSRGPPERPELKAIRLRIGEINPSTPGDDAIHIRFIDAGSPSGTVKALAHLTAQPVPNIAACRQFHAGKDEDWQRVRRGAPAPLPKRTYR